MIIYKTTNIINGKIYIGQDTKNNPNYFGSGKLIKNALKKYGKPNFRKDILDYCYNMKELNEREIHRIEQYFSFDQRVGYNIAMGALG